MFILEILLGLKSKQGDVTCAFLHADLEPGENVYVDMPLGFAQYSKDGTKKCLKLKKTLYGLRQSPRAFCTFADCPVFWQSKLQTETALSTMEAEIIALSACCRELFPIMDMVSSVTRSVKLPIGKTTMNVSIHEDNSGALVLAKTLPPQFTPRSKYYAIKTIWFREEIFKRDMQLLKIDTAEQLGDIFTKGLTRFVFEYLRKKILGW